MKQLIIVTLTLILFVACEKTLEYGLEGDLPLAPEFKIEQVPDDPNRFVVTDLSQGNFTRLWEFENGSPQNSKLLSDTVSYTKMGEYEIRLHVSSEVGSGTAMSTKKITVEQDVAGCPFPMLNEDCSSRCWRLSGEPGGVLVGPIPYSGEWFESPDITSNQADDRWCFNEDGTLDYTNGGATFSACQGYVDVEDYEFPAEISYSFTGCVGFEGFDQIQIDGIFMGVEDSGPTYDIVDVSETRMTLLAPIKPCDGSPSPGWFTLTFFSVE